MKDKNFSARPLSIFNLLLTLGIAMVSLSLILFEH